MNEVFKYISRQMLGHYNEIKFIHLNQISW